MSATRITINTDQFFKHLRTLSGSDYQDAYIQASKESRRAVAKTLRALADEMEKGEYVGSFAYPMIDTSNWTAEQCLESFKGTWYEREPYNAEMSLTELREHAQFTSPDCLGGDVDEL